MPFATLRRAFTTLAIVCIVSACSGPLEACTQIGCSSGLTVKLSSAPIGAFSVEILPWAGGNPPTYRVDCGGSAPDCGSQVFFPDLIVDRAQVRIVTTLGTVTHPIGPVSYATSYPNGRQCGPECRRATVTVGIPE